MTNAILKKTITQMIGIVGAITVSGTLQAASFDCLKATTNVEKLICSDPAISQMDSDLGVAYKAALDKAANKDALKQEQRQWLKTKLNTCKDIGCLSGVYSQRIAQLNAPRSIESANSSASKQPKFTLYKGEQFQLCRDFLDLINRVPKKEDPNCGLDYPFDAIAKKQGFKEIDWKEVDWKDYRDVLKNHLVYKHKDLTPEEIKKNEENFEKHVPNSPTRLWIAHFDANGDRNVDTVFKAMYRNCITESGSTFLVRNDGVLDEKAYARRFTNEFFMYQGKAYFYTIKYIGEMVGQDTYGYEKEVCSFN